MNRISDAVRFLYILFVKTEPSTAGWRKVTLAANTRIICLARTYFY